jgi:hypothetical protein
MTLIQFVFSRGDTALCYAIQLLRGQDEGAGGSKNVYFCLRSGYKNCPRREWGSKNGIILST